MNARRFTAPAVSLALALALMAGPSSAATKVTKVAGLLDFPRAEIVTLREAYEEVAGRTGVRALLRAFVPALLPPDFERRTRLAAVCSGGVHSAKPHGVSRPTGVKSYQKALMI